MGILISILYSLKLSIECIILSLKQIFKIPLKKEELPYLLPGDNIILITKSSMSDYRGLGKISSIDHDRLEVILKDPMDERFTIYFVSYGITWEIIKIV